MQSWCTIIQYIVYSNPIRTCILWCVQEVIKWQKIHKTIVPPHSRGRVYSCIQCIPVIKERAYCRGLSVLSLGLIDEDKEESFGGDVVLDCEWKQQCEVYGTDKMEGDCGENVTNPVMECGSGSATELKSSPVVLGMARPTEECMRETFNPDYDEWFLISGKRIRPLKYDGELYKGESGRKTVKHFKGMIPMDLVYHMVHCPNSQRTPEYRMVTRLVRNLAGMSGPMQHSPGSLRCLYSAFPSIPMQTLVSQIRMGHIHLKGTTQADSGTIADRIHLSGYVSGGKRRVSRADSQMACVLRKCVAMLQLAHNRTQESRTQWTDEQQINALGGMMIVDEEDVMMV